MVIFHVYCLVSVNILKESVNVNCCQFLWMEELNYPFLLSCQLQFYKPVISNKAKIYGLMVGSFNLNCHTSIFTSDVWPDNWKGITFEVTLMVWKEFTDGDSHMEKIVFCKYLPNTLPQAGSNTRSIFKLSKTVLN